MNNTRFYIKDENGHYVDRFSIIKVNDTYFYKAFLTFSDGCRRYITKDKAKEVLEKLQRHNTLARMNHTFEIICI